MDALPLSDASGLPDDVSDPKASEGRAQTADRVTHHDDIRNERGIVHIMALSVRRKAEKDGEEHDEGADRRARHRGH